jgi:hypothetical protein
VIRTFSLGEFTRRLQHHASIGAGWHGQHDVERLAALAASVMRVPPNRH